MKETQTDIQERNAALRGIRAGLMTEDDLIATLQCSRSHLYRMRRAGCPHVVISFHKTGPSRRIRYDLDEVRAWMAGRQAATA